MKKYSLLFLIVLIITSCSSDFLDRNPLTKPSNEAFWKTEKDAQAALIGCYNEWYSMNEVVYFDCVSDNAYNPYPWEGWQVQATGLASASNSGASYMSYDKIVRCNNFLANIDRPTMNDQLRNRMKAEARFLRAWNYYLKVVLYGDCPLVTKALSIEEANLPKNPKAEVVDFILKELNEIIPNLPQKYSNDEFGRITKGAALSLKARMEIFVGKYSETVASCREIMNLGYELFPDFKGVFYQDNEGNKEVILDVQYEPTTYANEILGVIPPASSGGWSSINPTQELVDAYECIDGKTIQNSPLYNPLNPYKNRDLRLSATVVCPGDLYDGKYLNTIDVKDPNGDYYAPYGRSKTGYYPRKYVDNPKAYSDIWKSGMNAIVIRYAEILLTYAEAKIELNSIDQTVYDALNKVRNRAGLPAVDQTVYNNQIKLRELVRRERRSELAMEGIRWFDICRWKIGPEVMNVTVKGAPLGTVNATTGALTLSGTQIVVEKRVFDATKNYLWPIPLSVLDATSNIKQNPGY